MEEPENSWKLFLPISDIFCMLCLTSRNHTSPVSSSLRTSNTRRPTVRKSLCLILAALLVVIAFPPLLFSGDVSVNGYWKDTNHDGVKDTYVSPYHRTSPNDTVKDNYGYPGNYNPNTGTTSPGYPDTYEKSHKPKNSLGW